MPKMSLILAQNQNCYKILAFLTLQVSDSWLMSILFWIEMLQNAKELLTELSMRVFKPVLKLVLKGKIGTKSNFAN